MFSKILENIIFVRTKMVLSDIEMILIATEIIYHYYQWFKLSYDWFNSFRNDYVFRLYKC